MAGGSSKRAKQKVLIVTADFGLRASIAQALIRKGHAVELADAPVRARAIAESEAIALCLVVAQHAGPETLELARDLAGRTGKVLLASERVEAAPIFDGIETIGSIRPEEIAFRAEAALEQADEPEPDRPEPPAVLTIEGFELDLAGHTLRDPGGTEVALTGGEFSLLAAFVNQPGRVLSRDQLRESLSGGGVDVYDRSIDVMVSRLRRKIERDPKRPSLILTVPGVGYKLAAPVRARAVRPSKPPPVAGVETKRPSVAVLRFAPFSTDLQVMQMAEGLAQDLIIALSNRPDLVVLSPEPSSFSGGEPVDPRVIGANLGARYLLQGSVRIVGDQLRVAAQLVDTEDGKHVWAERFDFGPGRDMPQAQDQLALEIVTAVRLKVLGQSDLPEPKGATRRLVTVMACRLAGVLGWSDQADAAVALRLIETYQRCCADAVTKSGGIMALRWADQLEAHFGLPPTVERGAEYAVEAALEIRDACTRIAAGEGSFQVQIGIATGSAILGRLGESSEEPRYNAIGQPIDTARKLSEAADVGEIVICSRTRELIGGLFELRAHEPSRSDAYTVLEPAPVQTRFAGLREHVFAPLFGRTDELAQLLRGWQEVRAGRGRVVFVSGDAGIGKSRLLAALRERIEAEPHGFVHFSCAPHRTGTAFFPVIEQIERAAGMRREDPAELNLSRVQRLLQPQGRPEEEVRWLSAELMSLACEPPAFAGSLTPPQRNRMILDLLLGYLERQSAVQAHVFEFEDVHWADSATIELLALLVDRQPAMRALVAITARPEFAPPWPETEHGSEIRLGRLPRAEASQLASWVAREHPLSEAEIGRIVDRADGVPLFVEELTRSVAEDAGPASDSSIPLTLEASLLARLDRVGLANEVAAVGAAIGRQFSRELLAEVGNAPAAQLDQRLDQLVKAGLIYRRGIEPDAVYTFKHALVRDAVYQRATLEFRRKIHARIVHAVINRFPELARTQPGFVALHALEGQLFDIGVDYAFEAGKRAVAIGAMQEAIQQLRLALGALQQLPKHRSRVELELEIILVLLTALVSVRGYTDPETQEAYARANARCHELGTKSRLEAVEHGLFRQYLVEAKYQSALRVAHDAHAGGRSGWELGIGIVRTHQGDPAGALDFLERANAASDAAAPLENLEELRVIGAPAYLALCRALLGDREGSRTMMLRALAVSERLGHPTARAFALSTTARVSWLLGMNAENLEIVNELRVLCETRGFRYWLANAECYLSWHAAREGRASEAADRVEHALEEYRATEARWLYPFFAGLAADIDLAAGRPLRGLQRVDEVLKERAATGEFWFDGALLPLRAKLLRKLDRDNEAEECLLAALSSIEHQGANLFAPAIASELATLWRAQHRNAEAELLLRRFQHQATSAAEGPWRARQAGAPERP